MVTEQWLPVPGYEGLYEVSDHGRVRGLDRIVSNGYRRKGRDLTWGVSNNRGYLRAFVRLSHSGRRIHIGVGMLVLRAFVGPCPEGMECCHRDANPFNNHLSNLRWDTHSANMLDTVLHGTHNMINRQECVRGHRLPPHIPGYRRVCEQCKELRREKRVAA